MFVSKSLQIALMIAVSLLGQVAASAQTPTKWRNVVRTRLPQGVKAVALEYTIVLAKNGKESPVDPDKHNFIVGDQFLVRIQAKDDMYVYIFTEGPTGERSCLQPQDEERPPSLKKGATVELPGDGYFTFAEPPGEEKFIVVATTEPSKDLSALANVVFRKPDQLLTPAEQTQQSKLLGQYKAKLQSVQQAKIAGAKSRGVMRQENVDAFAAELKAKKRGTIEEPPHDGETSTFAMAVSNPEVAKPELLINISMKSKAATGKP